MDVTLSGAKGLGRLWGRSPHPNLEPALPRPLPLWAAYSQSGSLILHQSEPSLCTRAAQHIIRAATGLEMATEVNVETQSGLAEVNGTRLYYEVAGSGEALVLVHAHTCDTRMWDRQFELYAESYTVVRYDARGYGRSALPVDTGHAPTCDLKALLENLGISHGDVLGLSMGGLIAIDFALAYPKATDALIVSDSLLGGYRWREAGRDIAMVHRTGREEGVPAARDRWLELDLFAPAMERPEVAARLRRMVSDYSGWHWLNRAPVRGEEPLAIDRLATIAVPTLVMVGDRDLPDFHTIADTLHERIPNSQKAVIPGAGHMANMEAPETFDEAVLGFLSGLAGD